MVPVLVLAFVTMAALPSLTYSQVEPQPTPVKKVKKNPYGSGIGMNIAITNSGFGLGAYLMRSISTTGSFVVDFMITTLKDDREQRFFGFFGESIIPNKQNYLHVAPLHIGFQRRMFREQIEDNFRPFIHLTGGPTFGWVSPYYIDTNFNGRRDNFEPPMDIFSAFPKGHFEMGFGGTIAIGAHFGSSKRSATGIRFGFNFHVFPQGIEILEPALKDPTTWFGTPTISLTFGSIK
jgi:hypothetical protein